MALSSAVAVTSVRPSQARALTAAAAPGVPGAPERLTVTTGRVYELRSSDAVVVFGGDDSTPLSLVVYRDTPLRFRAEAPTVSVAALTTTTTIVWLLPCEVG